MIGRGELELVRTVGEPGDRQAAEVPDPVVEVNDGAGLGQVLALHQEPGDVVVEQVRSHEPGVRLAARIGLSLGDRAEQAEARDLDDTASRHAGPGPCLLQGGRPAELGDHARETAPAPAMEAPVGEVAAGERLEVEDESAPEQPGAVTVGEA